mmetsp:Transcript_13765/g.30869  ORF Transcript_13765/g.30869 Transcript_13765/m.30869 type:complete len:286 (-) Transcript_13765:65-922(-)
MSALHVYGMRTLNDNWMEERLAPESSRTLVSNEKLVRSYEADVAFIGNGSKSGCHPLVRIARFPPRPSYGPPDDGFSEPLPTYRDYTDPRSRKDVVSKPPPSPRFATMETVPEVCYEDRRPVPGAARGFGSTLQRHEATHGERHWNTTHADAFGHGGPLGTPRTDPGSLHGAGVTTYMMENKKSGLRTGVLCGEQVRNVANPAMDTRTQRAWLYSDDPALKNIAYGGGVPELPLTDNELSAQIGEGAMKKVRDDQSARKGMLFRVATSITKGNSKRNGINVFDDG